MPKTVTIVMYHYVRDLAQSRFPRIKGLTTERFRHQLEYITRFYQVIRMEDLIAACRGGAILPANALLLTFDDGFCDHYDTVFPLLQEAGFQGSFFPCTQPLQEGRPLTVHKIHFVLASVPDAGRLLPELLDLLRREPDTAGTVEDLLRGHPDYATHRYDDSAVTTFKRLLQRDLPPELRERLVDHFFKVYVTEDERAFTRDLYVSADQWRRMKADGMYVGCHGHSHVWLNDVTPEAADADMRRSLAALSSIGLPLDEWVMCYPYGGYDVRLEPMMRRHGCVAGLLADPAIADLDRDAAFALPRLDTNDLPQAPAQGPNAWTRAVLEGA
jgi:peptidoglycan/xylan/chitin deacetylase (PgdA/CDA1 family)